MFCAMLHSHALCAVVKLGDDAVTHTLPPMVHTIANNTNAPVIGKPASSGIVVEAEATHETVDCAQIELGCMWWFVMKTLP